MAAALAFEPDQFNRIFPFYILINQSVCIESCGKTLNKIHPANAGMPFFDRFEVRRPKPEICDFENLAALCHQVVVLKCLNDQGITLRGQFELLPAPRQLLFIGSPWFESMEQVVENHLSLDDFAYHDPMIDLLHVLKNQEITNEDLKQLLTTVNTQKNELKKAAKEIQDIALFPMQNPDPLIRIDAQGTILSLNPAADRLREFTFQNVVMEAKDFWRTVAYQLAMDSGRQFFEVLAGTTLFSFVVVPIPENSYYNIYGRDSTEQKKNEEKIKLLSLVASANDNGVVFTNAQGTITWANEGYCRMTGFRQEEIVGRTPVEVGMGPLTDREAMKTGMLEPFFAGRKFYIELIHYRKDGSWFWSRLTGQAIADQQGEVTEYFTMIEDITQEKAKEEQLMILSSIAAENNRGVVIADKEGKVEWVNKSFETITGYALEEMKHRKPGHLLQGAGTNPETIAYLQEKIRRGEPFTCEILNYHKSGRPYWLLIQGQALRDKDGNIFKYFAIEEDITAEIETQKKLKEFENRFRLALEKIGDNVWEHDFQTRKTIFSNSNLSLLGIEIDQQTPIADLWWSSVYPEDLPLLEENEHKYRQGEIGHHLLEYRLMHGDGSIRWVLDRGVVIEKDNKGRPLKIIGTHTDVTKQKKSEQEHLETKKKLESILNEMSDVVWSYGWNDHNLLFITPSAEKLFGPLPNSPSDDRNWWEAFVHPDDHKVIASINAQLLEKGAYSEEYRIRTQDGQVKWVNNSGRIIFDSPHTPARLDGLIRNITDRKEAENTIRQQVDLQNILIDISATYINMDLEKVEEAIQNSLKELGEFVNADRAYVFDYDFAEYTTSNAYEWCAEGITPEIKNLQKVPLAYFPQWIEQHQKGEPFYIPEVQALPDDGPESLYGILAPQGVKSLITLPMIRNGALTGFVGFDSVRTHHEYTDKEKKLLFLFTQMLINVTERQQWEIQLQRQEEKYRNIIANMNLGLVEVDRNENVVFANQSFCEMSGYALEELRGTSVSDLLHFDISPNQKIADFAQGSIRTYEVSVRNKKGQLRWWFISEAPNFNDKSELLGTIGIHLDITDQKNLEKALIEAKNNAEASTRAKELFLANMSHEIRTPMNAIMGMSNQLDKTALDTQQKFYLNTIHSAADNLLIIINDILDLSKIEAGKLSLEHIGFEPTVVLERAMQVMMHKAEEKGLMLTSTRLDSRLSPVLIGDPYRLNQVLLNLLSNAVKFTEKGSVTLSCEVVNESSTHQTIRVRITDTGIGMEKAFAENLFQKFLQEDTSITRRYGGTGLGMSICKELVELMLGTMEVESQKGVGTTISFTVAFSRGELADLPIKDPVVLNTKVLAGRKILVVDDNEMNRLVAATILNNYGADVQEAENGSKAVVLLQQSTFDLVLMDVQMPVMDGMEATRIIRATISKEIPIIALTAFAIKGDDTRFLAEGMNDYLSKPFAENQLLGVVSRWLKEEPVFVPAPPAELPAVSGKLYDLSKLEAIAGGSDDFVSKMIDLFIEQSQLSLQEMRAAYQAHDLETVGKTAHRIKPSLDTMGIEVLKEKIRTLEKAREAALSSHEINTLLMYLEVVLKKVIDDLRSLS